MTVEIDISLQAGDWPEESELGRLAEACVAAVTAELGLSGDSELSLVFTDDAAMRALNRDWRGKDKATNVLSFPASQLEPGATLPPLLGDIVVAWETVSREADLEEKPFEHHLSHLVVHGMLHLLGNDHEDESEAAIMEDTERRVLTRLAIPDPYR